MSGPYSSGASLGGERIRFDRVYRPQVRVFSKAEIGERGRAACINARPPLSGSAVPSHVKGPERQRRCFCFFIFLLLLCWGKGQKA